MTAASNNKQHKEKQQMKKNEATTNNTMKKEEAVKEEVKQPRERKPQTEEMKKLNAMSKKLRMTAWRFVRRIQGSKNAEEMMTRLEEAYDKVEKTILEMTNESMLAFRFSQLNEAEIAYLKKMLNNTNNN